MNRKDEKEIQQNLQWLSWVRELYITLFLLFYFLNQFAIFSHIVDTYCFWNMKKRFFLNKEISLKQRLFHLS